jgi:hypothetical protein
LVQEIAFAGEGRLVEIARMIVGKTEGREVLCQPGQALGIGQIPVRLFDWLTVFGDDTFQIADGDIGILEHRSKRRERVDAAIDDFSGFLVVGDHDVANHDQSDAA